MGKVVSFINMKGGVGKTTLCKEIGFHLAKKRNKKILFIDVDPQINLTQSLFKRYGFLQNKQLHVSSEGTLQENCKLKHSEASIEEILNQSVINPPKKEKSIQILDEDVSIIPGELGLEFSLRNLNSGTLENGIYKFIEKNDLRSVYDFILIDCPPTYSSYTVAALLPSDYFLIPVKPEGYSILGIDMLMKVIDIVVDEKSIYFESKPLENLGIVFTDIKRRPSQGIINTLESIKNSDELKQRDLYYFNEYFLHNSHIPKDIDYFIDASNNENSKYNLDLLVDELLERMP
ncbi:ParA family protein [Virgibacillus halodenitrificans]|uniref:ParA family protein n=1 Tax=Virgibacillus halodenitrificans TaxID=1482 RepID=UPI000EF4E4AB|nr:AAA family ATPase [Virgibacillus halodenitrificans]